MAAVGLLGGIIASLLQFEPVGVVGFLDGAEPSSHVLSGGSVGIRRVGITAKSSVAYVLAGAPLSGLGLGCTSVASTARGTSAVEKGKHGLASGLLNTAAQAETALGLAALLAIAGAYTGALSEGSEPGAEALVAGYRLAFLVAAGVASQGVLAALGLIRWADGQKLAG